MPLVQATRSGALQLAPTTDVTALMAGNDGKYDMALDPLWNGEFNQQAEPFEKDEIAFCQCDHHVFVWTNQDEQRPFGFLTSHHRSLGLFFA